ncbi:hypothetical protein ABK040_010950 [Willaertia magna]
MANKHNHEEEEQTEVKVVEVKSTGPPKKKIPVTLLSGFLGSGKTTLLKHILRNRDNLKVAVIVNDMAELNIDNALVEKSGIKLKQSEEKLISMDNGCICCTLREDLLVELYELAQEGKFDYCVIESTGISEPLQVAETFTFDVEFQIDNGEEDEKQEMQVDDDEEEQEEKDDNNEEGDADDWEDVKEKDKENGPSYKLSDFASLDTCVTMVDAKNFLKDLHSIETLRERYGEETEEEENQRNIANLLIDQIEFANVILINKKDMVTEEELRRIKGLIVRLNPDAKIFETVNSEIPLDCVLNTKLFDFDKAASNPGWLKEIRGTHVPETKEYGISSFVYRRRKPFNTQKLYDFLYNDKFLQQQGVLRSKGYVWLCTRDDYCGDWEHAGELCNIHDGGKFFAAYTEKECEMMYGLDLLSKAKKDFVEKIGDRRQELVIIGQDLNKEIIEKRLDELLIADEEFEKGVDFYETICEDKFKPFTSFEGDWEDMEEDEENVVEEEENLKPKKLKQ